jgi:hypothetical protein
VAGAAMGDDSDKTIGRTGRSQLRLS